ncbi:UNVERIFIED_CONTAM: helix-turn-helix domain-containing protein [Microbacterium sp. SLM126]
MSDLFRGLGNPIRLELIAELTRYEDERDSRAALSVTELARRLEISRFSATYHLDILVQSGLAAKRQVGGRYEHVIAIAAVEELDEWVLNLLGRVEG